MQSVGMHHPMADMDRLYMWHGEGGRGLLNLVNVWKATIVSLATYPSLGMTRILPTRALPIKVSGSYLWLLNLSRNE